MPVYDPSGHDLLSQDAGALSSEKLAAMADLAEDLLRLAGTSFTGDAAERATRAVVLQVNLLVEREAHRSAAFIESESRGDQSVTYRGKEDLDLHPVAKRLAEDLVKSRRAGSMSSGAEFRPRIP